MNYTQRYEGEEEVAKDETKVEDPILMSMNILCTSISSL